MLRVAVLSLAMVVGIALLFVFNDDPCWANETLVDTGKAVPPSILDYYDAYNFVASYSTGSEREELTYDHGQRPETKRLNKIEQLMAELDARILRYRPQPGVPGGKPRREPVEGFIEIRRTGCLGNDRLVDVVIYKLQPEANAELIAQYEQEERKPGKVPSAEEIIELRSKYTLQKRRTAEGKEFYVEVYSPRMREIHRWSLVNGSWMRQEVRIVPLDLGYSLPKLEICR